MPENTKIYQEYELSGEIMEEDSGMTLIMEGCNDSNVSVRVISYDETCEHKDFNKLRNKKVKVVIRG